MRGENAQIFASRGYNPIDHLVSSSTRLNTSFYRSQYPPRNSRLELWRITTVLYINDPQIIFEWWTDFTKVSVSLWYILTTCRKTYVFHGCIDRMLTLYYHFYIADARNAHIEKRVRGESIEHRAKQVCKSSIQPPIVIYRIWHKLIRS